MHRNPSHTKYSMLTKLTEEVEGLKDSIGGGETVDERTRSSNSEVNAYKQEEALDKAVDEATAE